MHFARYAVAKVDRRRWTRLAAVIDSHTHLYPLRAARGRVWSPTPATAGVTRMLNVGLGGERTRPRSPAPSASKTSSPRVGRHPTEAAGFDDAEAERDRRAGGAREGAGDRRDRDRLLPRRPTPAEQRHAFEAQIEIADRHRSADRHPRPRPGGRDDRERRGLRAARREGRRTRRDPALLLRALACRRRRRARLVLLVRRPHHLPEVRRAARRRGGAAGRAGPGRDRRSVPGAADRFAASRTSPPSWSTPPASSPRRAASPTRSWRRRSRPTPGASSAGSGSTAVVRLGQNFLADPNLLDAIVRDAELDPADVVLEVGAGEGVLTERLAGSRRPRPRGRARPWVGAGAGAGRRACPTSACAGATR